MRERDFDRLIAKHVLGYETTEHNIVRGGRRSGIPSYSANIEHAWQVIERLRALEEIDGNKVQLIPKLEGAKDSDLWICSVENSLHGVCLGISKNKSAPMAICLAALEAVGANRK